MQGRPAPTPQPEAELWMGAHPDSPSTVGGTPLTDVIGADPAGVLGVGTVERFGPRLPFLMKVLAAGAPLSLQAHPTTAQAEAGYDAEEAAGRPAGAPDRNYRDRYHKPELLVAVEPFDGLCGFADPAVTAVSLSALEVDDLAPTVEALGQPSPEKALRDGVTGLMALSDTARKSLVGEVVEAARERGILPLAAELGDR